MKSPDSSLRRGRSLKTEGCALSENISEHLKLLCNEPVLGLSFVAQHVRGHGLHNIVSTRGVLLQQLSKARALVEDDRFDDARGLVRSADDRAKAVVEKLSALTERLKIVTEIELNVQTNEVYTPSKSRQSKSLRIQSQHSSVKSKKSKSRLKTPLKREEAEKLPSGFGQLLDDMLVSGDISADEYALKISRMAERTEQDD